MNRKTRFAIALASTIAGGATLAPSAQASTAAGNPFALSVLEAGYQLAAAQDKQKDGKCGEAKCGADKANVKANVKAKVKEASCGASKSKDGSCGADKKMKEASCGGNKQLEASCGANKKS